MIRRRSSASAWHPMGKGYGPIKIATKGTKVHENQGLRFHGGVLFLPRNIFMPQAKRYLVLHKTGWDGLAAFAAVLWVAMIGIMSGVF